MTSDKIKILFAVSECVPLCKTGGLADAVGSLPSALSKISVRSSIIMPFYKTLPKDIREKSELVAEFQITMGWRKQYAGLKRVKYRNRIYYFIDNETYFSRDNLYGYFDDSERYIFFCLAVLESLRYMDHIDIIHCNDWQTALIPTCLKKFYKDKKGYDRIKTLLTLHNLKFQGKLNPSDFMSMLTLNGTEDWLWQFMHGDQANLLKSGLYNADKVTTVSPTYANEIKYAYFGESLESCINDIEDRLSGILNGIDQKIYNPNKDSKIYWNYNSLVGKSENKESFLSEYNLPNDGSMLIGMVTRLDEQKGLDLVLYAMDKIMNLPVHFVILGTGDGNYERAFREVEAKYPDRARCFIMFDDAIAHKIYAASDVFLMPSRFEPCGLGQMIALKYGALPIVRETGGLADTVASYNRVTGKGTGFSFRNYNGDELFSAIDTAYDVYTNKKSLFGGMVEQAMCENFSWDKSAKKYKALYTQLNV